MGMATTAPCPEGAINQTTNDPWSRNVAAARVSCGSRQATYGLHKWVLPAPTNAFDIAVEPGSLVASRSPRLDRVDERRRHLGCLRKRKRFGRAQPNGSEAPPDTADTIAGARLATSSMSGGGRGGEAVAEGLVPLRTGGLEQERGPFAVLTMEERVDREDLRPCPGLSSTRRSPRPARSSTSPLDDEVHRAIGTHPTRRTRAPHRDCRTP